MRKPKSRKPPESDREFAALDRLARSVTRKTMRPLSPKERFMWEWAKRGRGRPRKPPEERSVPVQITMEPKLLRDVDELAGRIGKSRSELIAAGLKLVLVRQRRKAS